ncbi:hypothetical protein ACH4VM_24740 [Streptomyces sp. NPDC020792]|uniref:hypothetical protein n=1 Tax=Streptomyces sp. NPDC020792 TaxID=3365089 RepID=UPI0037BB2F86
MAQVLRMPTAAELPDGPRRQFVEALFSYYRDAGRPTLRAIADDIAGKPEFDAFTASRETIRKMLRGTTVPLSWDVVSAVLTVLCERAYIDPDLKYHAGGFGDGTTSRREELRHLWNEALDAPPSSPAPHSGWGGRAAYTEEPPF